MRRHHRWDDEERPEPDLSDPTAAAAMDRAARDVRRVKLFHAALVLLGAGLLGLALVLRVT